MKSKKIKFWIHCHSPMIGFYEWMEHYASGVIGIDEESPPPARWMFVFPGKKPCVRSESQLVQVLDSLIFLDDDAGHPPPVELSKVRERLKLILLKRFGNIWNAESEWEDSFSL